ncbi:MAG: hypothetical protein SFX19_06285 [Alphaproteobacteria bacterium]|nr:hypothetical protein [Alphaproteobacteria bacterium]
MPPFLMLIGIVFVVLMVMFGNNPVDRWRAEREKYGKDPLARQINKFNENRGKNGNAEKYTPPPGSTIYRLPPSEAQITAGNPLDPRDGEKLVRPAPDVPVDQWDSPYPAYMLAPSLTNPNNIVVPPANGGTSLMPGFGGNKN